MAPLALSRSRAPAVRRRSCAAPPRCSTAPPPPATPLRAAWRAARLALAAAAAAAALAPTACAITENQLLFLEAWRAVDRAYVDKTFNGQSWFRYREAAVKKTPMDTREETYAAIRAMLATLVRRSGMPPRSPTPACLRCVADSRAFLPARAPQEDPFTRFLDPEQLSALQGATSGSLSGVGVEISPSTATKGGASALVRPAQLRCGPLCVH